MVWQPLVSQGLLIVEASRLRRPLSVNTEHSQETAIHTPGGIRNLNLSKQARGRRTMP